MTDLILEVISDDLVEFMREGMCGFFRGASDKGSTDAALHLGPSSQWKPFPETQVKDLAQE